jgi:hypothetical protein
VLHLVKNDKFLCLVAKLVTLRDTVSLDNSCLPHSLRIKNNRHQICWVVQSDAGCLLLLFAPILPLTNLHNRSVHEHPRLWLRPSRKFGRKLPRADNNTRTWWPSWNPFFIYLLPAFCFDYILKRLVILSSLQVTDTVHQLLKHLTFENTSFVNRLVN